MPDKKINHTKNVAFFSYLCFHLSKQTANNFRNKLKLVIR